MKHRIVSAAIGLAVLGAVPAASAEDMPTLRYGQETENVHSISNLPFTVAQRKGFFTAEKLNVVVVPYPANIATAESFAAGHVPAMEGDRGIDMSRINSPYLIQAVVGGSDVVAVAGETANPVYSLIARPEIKTFADLKGKLVGMSAPADTITITTRKVMSLHGVKAADFQVKRIRGTGPRFDCLKTGDCVAVPLGQPQDVVAVNQGFHRLGTSNEVGKVVFDIDIVRRDWAKTHKDVLVRYVRGLASAMRFINDPKNREEVTKTIADVTGEPDAVARELMATYADPKKGLLPRQAEIDMKGVANVVSLMGEADVLPKPLPAADRFVDLTYLKAAGLQ